MKPLTYACSRGAVAGSDSLNTRETQGRKQDETLQAFANFIPGKAAFLILCFNIQLFLIYVIK